MSNSLDEQVTISLPKGTLLVLFEFLSHSYDTWRGSDGKPSDDSTFLLAKPDAAERTALWQLEGAIESTLPEIFASDYKDLIGEWKQRLIRGQCFTEEMAPQVGLEPTTLRLTAGCTAEVPLSGEQNLKAAGR